MPDNEIFPNPTVKNVIFQIKFSPLFSIENKIGDFQLKIMEKFPESSLSLSQQILWGDIGNEVKMKEVENQIGSNYGKKIWQFKSKNNIQLSVTFNSIDIFSTSHKTYNSGEEEKFRDLIRYGVDAFYDIFKIPMINRIGLRYIDNAPLPSTLENDSFFDYYNTALPLQRFNLNTASEMVTRVVVKKGIYQLGYVELLDLQNKILVIDFDAFTQNIKFGDYLKTTDDLHDIIHDEYYKIIKEPVKEIMRRR
jgi:uncharacterized protein (TIGR04255 family)